MAWLGGALAAPVGLATSAAAARGVLNVADRLSSDVSIRLGSRVNTGDSSLLERIFGHDCRRTPCQRREAMSGTVARSFRGEDRSLCVVKWSGRNDKYVEYEVGAHRMPVPWKDIESSAQARQDVPTLVSEIRLLRAAGQRNEASRQSRRVRQGAPSTPGWKAPSPEGHSYHVGSDHPGAPLEQRAREPRVCDS